MSAVNFIAQALPKNVKSYVPLPSIGDVIHQYKLGANKRLSQNFLLDMNLNRKIVKQAGALKDSYVCEVGPGPGGITRAILENEVSELALVEKDKRFLLSLQLLADSVKSDVRMAIYHADVLKFQMNSLFPDTIKQPWENHESNLHIIGNLPFNVSLPLLLRWLKSMNSQEDIFRYGRVKMTLTFQKEVAERMVAQPGTRQRCRLSVISQSIAEVQHKFSFLGRSCVPAPKVDVGVINMVPREKPSFDTPFPMYHRVVSSIFNFRQKYCRAGVDNLFPQPLRSELTGIVFTRLPHINPKTRIYELGNEEFNDITHVYMEICDTIPDLLQYNFREPKIDAKKWENFLAE